MHCHVHCHVPGGIGRVSVTLLSTSLPPLFEETGFAPLLTLIKYTDSSGWSFSHCQDSCLALASLPRQHTPSATPSLANTHTHTDCGVSFDNGGKQHTSISKSGCVAGNKHRHIYRDSSFIIAIVRAIPHDCIQV